LAKTFKQLEKKLFLLFIKMLQIANLSLPLGGKFPAMEAITIALNQGKINV